MGFLFFCRGTCHCMHSRDEVLWPFDWEIEHTLKTLNKANREREECWVNSSWKNCGCLIERYMCYGMMTSYICNLIKENNILIWYLMNEFVSRSITVLLWIEVKIEESDQSWPNEYLYMSTTNHFDLLKVLLYDWIECIKAIQDDNLVDSSSTLLQWIHTRLQGFQHWKIKHIPKKEN